MLLCLLLSLVPALALADPVVSVSLARIEAGFHTDASMPTRARVVALEFWMDESVFTPSDYRYIEATEVMLQLAVQEVPGSPLPLRVRVEIRECAPKAGSWEFPEAAALIPALGDICAGPPTLIAHEITKLSSVRNFLKEAVCEESRGDLVLAFPYMSQSMHRQFASCDPPDHLRTIIHDPLNSFEGLLWFFLGVSAASATAPTQSRDAPSVPVRATSACLPVEVRFGGSCIELQNPTEGPVSQRVNFTGPGCDQSETVLVSPASRYRVHADAYCQPEYITSERLIGEDEWLRCLVFIRAVTGEFAAFRHAAD